MSGNGNDIQRSLGRIEGKLDAIHEDISEIKSQLGNHDARIRQIEKRNVLFSSLTAGFTTLVLEFRAKLGF